MSACEEHSCSVEALRAGECRGSWLSCGVLVLVLEFLDDDELVLVQVLVPVQVLVLVLVSVLVPVPVLVLGGELVLGIERVLVLVEVLVVVPVLEVLPRNTGRSLLRELLLRQCKLRKLPDGEQGRPCL